MNSPSDAPRDAADHRQAMADAQRAADEAERDFARRELIGAVSSFAATLLVAGGCVAYFAVVNGDLGLRASGIGAAAVIVGAAISSVLPFFVDRPIRPLVRSFAGLVLRAGLPLGVVFWAKVKHQDWLDAGMLITVVAAYVAGWIVEAIWRMGLRNAAIRRLEAGNDRRGSKTVNSVL
jgi:hypothetical protein